MDRIRKAAAKRIHAISYALSRYAVIRPSHLRLSVPSFRVLHLLESS